MSRQLKSLLPYLVSCLILLLLFSKGREHHIAKDAVQADSLMCILALRGHSSSEMSFSVGYNYELAGRFSSEAGCKMEIRLAGKEENFLDSLRRHGNVLLVLPYSDSIAAMDEFMASPVLSDSTMWLVRADMKGLAREIRLWFSYFNASDEVRVVKTRFTPSYEPYRRMMSGKTYATVSPYDELIKKYAGGIGLDWRMLCSLIWQESRFRIEAESGRNAAGLMQMMPATAGHYGVEDMLNPEENIKAGTSYLSRLQRIFSPYAEGSDLTKITLAAYNAGEGRILNCMEYAKATGREHSTWTDIVQTIETMRDSTYSDTDPTGLRADTFHGHETIAYVDKIMSLYEAFCAIAP